MRAKTGLTVAGMALTLMLAACSGRSPGGLIPVKETVPGASTVDVLVATTRAPSELPGQVFTGERDDRLNFAEITVSIPPDANRRIGDVQTSSSEVGDPSKDFVALRTQRVDEADALKVLRQNLRRAPKKEVLVFVHGFNTRFGEAVFRMAQIAHDSNLIAAPLLFTWPSRGDLFSYTYDRESANFSRDALERLLQTLQRDPDVAEIDILAHSMGNWVALEALRQMAIRDKRLAPKIKNVMLAAPDVDIYVFRKQIAEMGSPRPPFTLFVSRDDEALRISRKVWGNVPRIGAVDPNAEPFRSQFREQQITVIDLTDVTTDDRLNHSKFAESPEVVKLIGSRLANGQAFAGKTGIGEKVLQVTTGAASTVGSAAGLAVSAPLAVIDGDTRQNLGSQFEHLGDNLGETVRNVTHY
ncbi:alpha/beta hydrolase [uncultured Rhodoblastus sp.]|uniref:alpha/beta hydrolase n=1 Tax=uncultured Rhodoblastus sp. TaxID=543037 RepID=UPI0025FBE103|nr:alpha/beta hydrolase [uncultured Rhodoblastus sp.]